MTEGCLVRFLERLGATLVIRVLDLSVSVGVGCVVDPSVGH